MEDSETDIEMSSADDFHFRLMSVCVSSSNLHLEDILGMDPDKRLRVIMQLKNLIIGSNRQKNVACTDNVLPKLLRLLVDSTAAEELRYEVAVVLGSLAHGSRQQVACLVGAGVVQQLLTCLTSSHLPFVEACLRCLRTIFSTDVASVYLLYENENVIESLLRSIDRSNSTRECVCVIFSRSCLNETHQAVLQHAGIIEAVVPSLFSPVSSVQLPALRCFSRLCVNNYDTSYALGNAMFEGYSVLARIEALMRRDGPKEVQIAAAKCLSCVCRAGVVAPWKPVITHTVMPTLVRACRDDPLLSSPVLRVEACATLAYLVEEDTVLQQLTSYNNQCLQTLAHCLATAVEDQDNLTDTCTNANANGESQLCEDLEHAALTALASLTLNVEEIRRKVAVEIPILLECAMRGLCAEKRKPKHLLASLRCLHALSRSVEQLRTVFQDRTVWKTLLQILQSTDDELVAWASAILCNLSLDFSPCKDSLIEAGGVEALCALTRREEESLRLNGVWALMNLAYRADDQLKQAVLKALGADEILRLLTEAAPQAPIVLRLLSLVRNLLSQSHESRGHVDRVMTTHGTKIMQTVVFVLEGEYPAEAKELALCVLANIAAGDTAKEFLMTNEDILRKVTNYMMVNTPQLQLAATTCISNLVFKEDQGGALERQTKLRDLGVGKMLQQLHHTNDPALFERVKLTLQHFS